MKKYLFVLMFTLLGGISLCVAQNSGIGFNYQAVVRKADGSLLTNSNVNLRISLYPSQGAKTPTWVETHNVCSDVSGCIGITVGKGKKEGGNVAKYSDINFAADYPDYYWMKIEIKEGETFREVSYAQLPSSPYSEVAFNATYAIPAGAIVPFAGPVDKIPDGWLLCDGTAVRSSVYANLFNAIGKSWGGDGDYFNLPDLRGMFLRGVSGDSGNDPDADDRGRLIDGDRGNTGNKVGSYQEDAIRNITGQTWAAHTKANLEEITNGAFTLGDPIGNYKAATTGSPKSAVLQFDASKAPDVKTGSDNRPKNAYVNYIIKY